MGVIDSPPLPVAWRERNAAPIAAKQVGLEVIGRTNKQGEPAIYWSTDRAQCYKLAERDGWKF